MANKIKKRLTQDQEFQIMKLVLDKFLWLGFIVIAYAVFLGVIQDSWGPAVAWGISGVIILVLFMVLIVREYEILR
jgi:fatty acid desaturase